MPKVSLIGFGAIGQNVAQLSILKGLADEIVAIDLNLQKIHGAMEDIAQSLPDERKDVHFTCANTYEPIKNADMIVITAGTTGLKPGEDPKSWNRDLMLQSNTKIIAGIAEQVKKYAPEAFVLVVTNPMDTMVQIFREVSGLPAHKVVGEAGTDDNRFRYFIAKTLGVSSQDVDGFVVGPHGNQMVPLFSTVTQQGMKVKLTPAQKEEIRNDVVFGAARVIEECGISPFRTVSAAILASMEAYLHNTNRILGLSTYDEARGYYYAWPSVLGRNGVVRRVGGIEDLEPEEKEALLKGLKTLEENNQKAKEILKQNA